MFRLNQFIILLVTLLSVGTGCSTTRHVKHERRYSHMENRLATYIAAQDARIGVAVIIDGKDTVSVNGNRDFPMLSVYKFPQALAVADYCMKNGVGLSDTISIHGDEMKENTWSPMRDRYGVGDLRLPLYELFEYSLRDSDNNACDILFRLIGGTHVADSLMKAMGYDDIVIASTEDEMHRDIYLCYQNRSTPIAMASLFDRFYRREMRHDSPLHEAIGEIMMACTTGNRRLPAPLLPTNAVIGHKTGTGDVNSQGRIIGVNDTGYVFLPNGGGYAVAVFVSDSARNMEDTERMIADISDIIFRSLFNK
ncbi:class A beta-lactamase [Muribaculum sp.]|uniref:class A beta-lactamase n=1 Tax=Muribaculum sp. TaxID=1918611 RepID=UPI0023D117A0|nr:class A beta-lactamase [Muribaculum sp.]MDE5705453.1 class A beta-lactamase [Muribaculum sp.]